MVLVISRFGFECWIWVLITSVPDLCILFTFGLKSVNIKIFNDIPLSCFKLIKMYEYIDWMICKPEHSIYSIWCQVWPTLFLLNVFTIIKELIFIFYLLVV